MMNARAVTKALGGRWCGSYGICKCPAHDDRTPSLSIRDGEGEPIVKCHAGCDWRDVKDALRQSDLLDPFVPGQAPRARPTPIHQEEEDSKKTELALRLWGKAVPLQDTLGWRYFTERRGLHIGLLDDLSHALRWHQGIAAVVALMIGPISNKPIGVHRTFLHSDGTKRERKMLGKAGVVRLSRDEDVSEGLGICEGVEDGLAVLLSGWAPLWVATSAGAIERFPVLPGIESMTIFADTDEVGMEAARACAERWDAAGREAVIREPQ